MKKRQGKEDTYKVSTKKQTGTELPKWESLRDLNIEIRGSVNEIMKKIVTIKTVIEKDLKDATELNKTLKGTEEIFKEILEKVDLLTSLHSKTKDSKIIFFIGDVKIGNDKENSVYIDTLTSYMHLGEMLDTFANVSIATLMAEFTETVEKEKEIKNGK